MVTREDIQNWLERLDAGTLEVREVEPGLVDRPLARWRGGGGEFATP